jgi:hypothetical protein
MPFDLDVRDASFRDKYSDKYRGIDTISPNSTVPFRERPVVALDDRARDAAAIEIIRAHTPDQLSQILGWCEQDMRDLIAVVQARHGLKGAQ